MSHDLLRFTTIGSVDDGKSTLVGRLLHDSGGVYEDQLQSARKASLDGLDLAFITDGLRAEREQGITIDVAYRYFATERRKFIIVDTPGHEQYTRNMATGASNAQLAVVLLDARKGVLTQTVRHIYIAWLLGIKHIVVAVNKMDLVGLQMKVFDEIKLQFEPLFRKLTASICFIPLVAIDGDNVVRRSQRMTWFEGPSLLEYLETVSVESENESQPFRMPVQYVIRSGNGSRSYAGQIASGTVTPGNHLIALPSGHAVRVKSILTYDGELQSAFAPRSVSLCFEENLDIGRGDMLVDVERRPHSTRHFQAVLVWMSESPLGVGRPYLIKHTSQYVCASVVEIKTKLDISTLNEQVVPELKLNDIGTVEIETHKEIYCDPYSENRHTGCFIVVDPITNMTAGAGMISDVVRVRATKSPRTGGHRGLTVWFTGLSSAGKTTLSQAIYQRLWAGGHKVEMLDGDEVRRHLSSDLGFSRHDRDENIRRIGFLAEMLTRNGIIALVSAISPYRSVREEIRQRIPNFVEVYVNAPLEVCEQRDVKGLYRKARTGEIAAFTGITDPYEPPALPEVECQTDKEALGDSVEKVLRTIESRLM
jgi:bifunctional enzyme CysN/CysC